ncbi:Transposase [Streptomyces sp. 2231.1]|nr:Transposase [Streptomyces sp. 2231.1]
MPEIWAGVDIGKTHHHAVVINTEGERLLSRRIENDETELLALIGDVLAISDDVLWAVDLNHGGAALLIGLLTAHDQPVAYLTGLAVHRASATYRARERPTRRTPSSSPTRPASGGTWVCCGPATRLP